MIKPLKLTLKQKEELINLCNKTFSKVSWHFWSDHYVPGNTGRIGYTSCKIDNVYYPEYTIHWFEFVVRMAIDEERDEFMNFYLNVCSPDESK